MSCGNKVPIWRNTRKQHWPLGWYFQIRGIQRYKRIMLGRLAIIWLLSVLLLTNWKWFEVTWTYICWKYESSLFEKNPTTCNFNLAYNCVNFDWFIYTGRHVQMLFCNITKSVTDFAQKVEDLQRKIESLKLRIQPFTISNIIQDPDKVCYHNSIFGRFLFINYQLLIL